MDAAPTDVIALTFFGLSSAFLAFAAILTLIRAHRRWGLSHEVRRWSIALEIGGLLAGASLLFFGVTQFPWPTVLTLFTSALPWTGAMIALVIPVREEPVAITASQYASIGSIVSAGLLWTGLV